MWTNRSPKRGRGRDLSWPGLGKLIWGSQDSSELSGASIPACMSLPKLAGIWTVLFVTSRRFTTITLFSGLNLRSVSWSLHKHNYYPSLRLRKSEVSEDPPSVF
jgi:hypothetical protein